MAFELWTWERREKAYWACKELSRKKLLQRKVENVKRERLESTFSSQKCMCSKHFQKKEIFDVIPLPHILYSHLQAYKGSGSHVAELGSVLKIKPALHLIDSPSPQRVQNAKSTGSCSWHVLPLQSFSYSRTEAKKVRCRHVLRRIPL